MIMIRYFILLNLTFTFWSDHHPKVASVEVGNLLIN